MAALFIGSAAIFGVDGTLTVTAVIAAADFTMIDATMGDGFTVFEQKDGEGNTVGAAAAGREQSATFTIVPYSTMVVSPGADEPATQLTEVRENTVFPDPLATVVIAGFGAGGSDQIKPFTGSWAYVGGGTITPSSGGQMAMKLPCERYNDDPATQTVFTP